MTIADVIDKGSLTLKKANNSYSIEYSNYDEYGNIKPLIFEARNIQLAFMKLEEYLKYAS